MGAPRSNKEVQAGIEVLAGRSVARMAKGYRRDINPLIAAIKKAKSPEGLKRALGPTRLKEMGTTAEASALADCLTQVALIGRVAATPRGMSKEE
jgi:hypothetical protein